MGDDVGDVLGVGVFCVGECGIAGEALEVGFVDVGGVAEGEVGQEGADDDAWIVAAITPDEGDLFDLWGYEGCELLHTMVDKHDDEGFTLVGEAVLRGCVGVDGVDDVLDCLPGVEGEPSTYRADYRQIVI